jgi:hypothetical protein
MRALIAGVLLLATTGVVAGCGNGRGGRLVVVTPDEVAGRRGDSWHVTQEPSGEAAAPAADRDEPAR